MKTFAKILTWLAAIGILIGLAVRLAQSVAGTARPAALDPVFYWRGAVAFLLFAIVILLLERRNN